ncbi:YciI family protein [Allonocardiopsis opalescens]|uniref:YCII-related domain-containing protein n=1 Tax=Allonocardiopsis opalescens TaxID=1144618 RepID=A0A2T0QEF4_9ACTN|nr:YciI family protein [Allonocardiopsis opalescens]PRY02326.1 hypothetical protein CLV72_101928 [Allonocardiopsis opalescens]
MLMIYSDPERPWTGSEDDRAELRELFALRERLAATGELIASDALTEPAQARTVRVRGGSVAVTDGPFAEVKEHLAGYFLVDCASLDRALEIAALTPVARRSAMEVRPILDEAVMRREL